MNIDVSHLYITCRHGILVEEDHSTSFCIMPSLMEEEADNFGIVVRVADFRTLLQDSVCHVLLVVSSVPSCKVIEETCQRTFATHFDYCTTASIDFIMLDEATFGNILQVNLISIASRVVQDTAPMHSSATMTVFYSIWHFN